MDQQWAYFMLGTQPDISAAGMLPLTVKRWSGYAFGATPDALSDALSGLVARRFLVIDEDTEELLVRSFVKWDGGINNEKRRPVVVEAAHAIASPILRGALAKELRDLSLPDAICDALSDSPSDAISPSDRVVVTEVGKEPQPTTINPQPSGGEPSANTDPPSRFCQKHPEGSTEPCGMCADARERNKAWSAAVLERSAAERDAAIAARMNCTECVNGFVVDSDGDPIRKCTHQRKGEPA
jgi:hypothetical protein